MSTTDFYLLTSFVSLLASAGCAADDPFARTSIPLPTAAYAFNALEGGAALGPREVAESYSRASFDAELAANDDMALLSAELNLAGCEFGPLHLLTFDTASGDDHAPLPGEPGAYEVAVAEGACSDGRVATLQAMRASDTLGIVALTALLIELDAESGLPTSVDTVEVVDGELLREGIDLLDVRQHVDDLSTCSPEDEHIDVACAGTALSIDKCWICKKAAGLVIGQAGRACGWGSVAACGALGLAGGVPGLVCGAAVWSICKLGINKVKSWGAERVCRYLGYCG